MSSWKDVDNLLLSRMSNRKGFLGFVDRNPKTMLVISVLGSVFFIALAEYVR
jgi:hypothetical protein